MAVFSFLKIPYLEEELLEFKEIADLGDSTISLNFSGLVNNFSLRENRCKPLVACIDDSPQILKIMEQIILKQDYHFIGVQESLQVIPTLIRYKPDLIFLDLGMPVVNGYQVCQQLRSVSALKDIPIIILTAQNTVVDRIKTKVLGSSQFITKPIRISTVVNILNSYLKKAP